MDRRIGQFLAQRLLLVLKQARRRLHFAVAHGRVRLTSSRKRPLPCLREMRSTVGGVTRDEAKDRMARRRRGLHADAAGQDMLLFVSSIWRGTQQVIEYAWLHDELTRQLIEPCDPH